MGSFTNIAPYYDLLMEEVPYEEWIEYYQALLKKHFLEPYSYLDLCCGTGILSELLAKQEKEVEGLDFSKLMIQQARTKANQKKLFIPYYVHDATSFDLGRYYDAVFSFFDSLNYILDRKLLYSCFKCVYNHLNIGGSFIFDLNTVYAFESHAFNQEKLDLNAPLRYSWKGNYDSETRLIKVDMDFWINEEHFKEVHIQRGHDIKEVCLDLMEVGFKKVKCYQSYTYKKPSKYSDRVHILAFK